MRIRWSFFLLVMLLAAPAQAGPCGAGQVVGDDCLGIGFQGCCPSATIVRWCQGGTLCELSCAGQPACGWKAGAGVYDCGAAPASDPSCTHPYSCGQGGCAPAYEDEGCCGCPCEDCVCGDDPYCCLVSWDATCVQACADCGGCGSPDGCKPAETGGCPGCSCESCVCGIDPYCCAGKWDLACAALCVESCGGDCEVCVPDCGGAECGGDGCGGFCGFCPAGYDCIAGDCIEECVPNCAGRECGGDGCGGSCGQCAADEDCNLYGICLPQPCEPDCSGLECGDDGCEGSCGQCDDGWSCQAGSCVELECPPQCDGKDCGPDGCGGFCGFCAPGTICNDDLGKCTGYCPPDCTGKECGDDGCGGSCGACSDGLDCLDGACKPPCFPLCENKACGPDFCGGSCGECPPGAPYCVSGICAVDCVPSCAGKECGDDGCGSETTCGTCPMEWYCQSGMCVPFCQPQCLVPPDYLVYKACGWDECPGAGICGTCPAGQKCSEGWVCVEEKCSCEGKECGVPEEGCPSCGECGEGLVCDLEIELDPETHVCEACQPVCVKEDGLTPKQCGDDSCGGECGTCPVGWSCDEDPADGDAFLWDCEPCTPQCMGKQCGDDGCGGSCGQCPGVQQCDEDSGLCTDCVPQCMVPPDFLMPMECGPNNCPPGCAEQGIKPCEKPSDCDPGQQCNAFTGMCVACGACGVCPGNMLCDTSLIDDPDVYVCEPCTPSCAGKECGDNGCGGMCGSCPIGWECVDHTCNKPCEKACLNKECGPDGCPAGCKEEGTVPCGPLQECEEGICDPVSNLCVPCSGSCGLCDFDEICSEDYICIPAPANPCEGKECGDDGQGGSCGACAVGDMCVGGFCVPMVEMEEDVGGGEDVVGPQQDTTVGPGEDTQPPGQCPPGYKWFYGKCVLDTPPPIETGGGDGGGGCTAGEPVTGSWLMLALMLMLMLMRLGRRKCEEGDLNPHGLIDH